MATAISYHEAFKILDLSSTASSDDAEAAYRDLIKVWHPDRFPSDKRLKERAEEKTKQLNEAMNVIRTHTKVDQPDLPPIAKPRPTSPDKTRSERAQPHSPDATESTVSPLYAHRRFRASLLYVLASAVLLAICYTSLLRPGISAFTGAFATAVALWAMHELIENIFIVALHVPIFSMNREGIHLFGLGDFSWRDLQEIESRLQHRSAVVTIRLHRHHLATCNAFRRILLRLRSLFFRAHYIVPFSDLTISPPAVVALARHHFIHSAASCTPSRRRHNTVSFWLSGIQLASVILAVGWYLFGRDPHPIEILPYFGISAACQVVRLTYERLKRC